MLSPGAVSRRTHPGPDGAPADPGNFLKYSKPVAGASDSLRIARLYFFGGLLTLSLSDPDS